LELAIPGWRSGRCCFAARIKQQPAHGNEFAALHRRLVALELWDSLLAGVRAFECTPFRRDARLMQFCFDYDYLLSPIDGSLACSRYGAASEMQPSWKGVRH
jgi:hypothetical protein